MNRLRRRHAQRLSGQLPDVASELARLVDSGATLHLAIAELGSTYAPPAGEELAEVAAEMRRGALLGEALRSWENRSGRRDVKLLSSACRLGVAHGGNLVAALEGVSRALGDSLELEEEAKALSAQSRTSAYVIMALPVVGLGLFSAIDGSVARFTFTTPEGLILLVVGLLLDAVGALVMLWLIRRALR